MRISLWRTCRFMTSAVVRSNKRRAYRFFFLGFCGWVTGAMVRGGRRGLKSLQAAAGCVDVRQRRPRKLGTSIRFAVSHTHACGISCSRATASAAMPPPDGAAATPGMRDMTSCHASQNCERIDATDKSERAACTTSASSILVVEPLPPD